MSRRQEILSTVKDIMLTEGVNSSFTMTTLAKKVDIGKSTIYEYFDDKDQLLKEAFLMIIEEYVEEMLMFDNLDELPFEEAMKAQLIKLMSKAYLSRMTLETFTNEHLHYLPPKYKTELEKKMENIKERMAARFIHLFNMAIKEGKATEEGLAQNEPMISSLIMGAIFKYIDEGETIDITSFVDKLYSTLLLLMQ